MSVEDRRFFDHDPETGITEFFHYDEASDGFTMHTQQDVTGLLDINKYLSNEDSGERYGDMTRVASIPLIIFAQLKRDGVIDNPKRFKAWLNDPENRYFRTRGGRV